MTTSAKNAVQSDDRTQYAWQPRKKVLTLIFLRGNTMIERVNSIARKEGKLPEEIWTREMSPAIAVEVQTRQGVREQRWAIKGLKCVYFEDVESPVTPGFEGSVSVRFYARQTMYRGVERVASLLEERQAPYQLLVEFSGGEAAWAL